MKEGLEEGGGGLSVARIHVDDVGLEEFIEKYEKPYVPCVIQGATDNWQANEKWTPQVIPLLNK